MITHSGANVFPERSGHGIDAPTLEDIAIGLGRTARFAGQTKHWYPVLAHTIVVSRLVQPEHRLHALLHDAPEAIVGDVPTTWKTQAARDREDELIRRIYASLAIELPGPGAHDAVARADRSALVAEAHVLGHACPQWWDDDLNPDAVRWTKGELRFCRQYLRADRAALVFSQQIAKAGSQIVTLKPSAISDRLRSLLAERVH